MTYFSSTCDGITLISVFGNKLRETAPIRNHFCFRQSNHQPKLGYQITEIMNTVDKKKKRSCFLYRIIFTMFSHRQRQNNFPSRDHIEFQFRKHEDRTTRITQQKHRCSKKKRKARKWLSIMACKTRKAIMMTRSLSVSCRRHRTNCAPKCQWAYVHLDVLLQNIVGLLHFGLVSWFIRHNIDDKLLGKLSLSCPLD